jgi:hypothetical protein
VCTPLSVGASVSADAAGDDSSSGSWAEQQGKLGG